MIYSAFSWTGAEFEIEDIAYNDPRFAKVNFTGKSGTGGKEVRVNIDKNYSGHVAYDVRVMDASKAYSMQVSMNVYVVLNPCDHGICAPGASSETCLHPQRSVTFDPYICHCDVGYEGLWCEKEIDECKTATCSPISDCVDLIGTYRCQVNSAKLAAIILCSLLAVSVGSFIAYKLEKKKAKVEPW